MLENIEDAEGFNIDTVVDNCILLFADGIGNSDKAIVNAYQSLKDHPEEMEKLLDDHSHLSTAIDECLRQSALPQER